jgi:hypothetical protein
MKLIAILLALVGFFVIPLLLRDASFYYLRQSSSYWILLNADSISRIIGALGTILFVFAMVKLSIRKA